MVAVYIIILCFSAALAAFSAARLAWRLSRLLNQSFAVPGGVFAALSSIAFLTVVGAPASVLVGALLVLGSGMAGRSGYLPPIAVWGVPLIATVLGLSSFHLPALGIPPAALACAILLGWFLVTVSAWRAPNAAIGGGIGFLLALLPLCMAPVLFPVPHSITLDAALIMSALGGLIAASRADARLAIARPALGFLLGWLIVVAALNGAWPAALVSALAWCAAIAYATLHPTSADPDALSP